MRQVMLLDYLRKLDGSLSIGDLINKIEKEERDGKKELEKADKALIKRYTNVYLKKFDEETIFGPRLVLIKVDEMKSAGYNTDYKRLYSISGEQTSISERNTYSKSMDPGNVDNHFSLEKLGKFKIITKEEYKKFIEKVYLIQYQTQNLINDGRKEI